MLFIFISFQQIRARCRVEWKIFDERMAEAEKKLRDRQAAAKQNANHAAPIQHTDHTARTQDTDYVAAGQCGNHSGAEEGKA